MRNFKLILRTVGIFLLAVALLSGFFMSCYLRGENFHYQDALERAELSGKLDLLVCGASNVLFGVRPDLLDETLGSSSYNLSGTLLSMQGRYTLIETELRRNPIQTVLIEVSPDTLIRLRAEEGPHGDLPMLGRLEGASARWDYLCRAFTLGELPEVYYDMVSKGMEAAVLLATGKYQTRNQTVVRGWYDNKKESWKLNSDYRAIYHTEHLSEAVAQENVEMLERIVALCKAHGAEPILFSVPQSKSYNLINDNLDFYQRWYSDFAAAHGLRYLNFNLLREKLERLPDEENFYDSTHLNSQGGQTFTRLLAETLSRLRAGEDLSQRFYASYAEQEQTPGILD